MEKIIYLKVKGRRRSEKKKKLKTSRRDMELPAHECYLAAKYKRRVNANVNFVPRAFSSEGLRMRLLC